MRKKPQGSLPYKETWYLFGAEFTEQDINLKEFAEKAILQQLGIKIKADQDIGISEEEKPDINGVQTKYKYFNFLCSYVSGQPQKPEGVEKIEWVKIENLKDMDIVPPSRKLFKQLGYL